MEDQDPLKNYRIEDCSKMSREHFNNLLEIYNKCFDEEVLELRELKEITTVFNSLEEIMEYYTAIPLKEVIRHGNKFLIFLKNEI